MPNLRFKQLLVLSNSAKSANQFTFGPNLNLITAKDNNVGKSTIVKLLFWSFGCEPSFDTTWTNTDSRVIVAFEIDSKGYEIYRYKSLIKLRGSGNDAVETFTDVSGDLSVRLATLFGFHALLPSRKDSLVVPPPAYYFVPFYIDQKRSWSSAWEPFDKLGQFKEWKQTIIKYHVGLLTPRYFEIQREKFENKDLRKAAEEEIHTLDVALEVVKAYAPPIRQAVALSAPSLEKMSDDIRKDIFELTKQQELVFEKLSILKSDLAFLENQEKLATGVIVSLEKDYSFTVENLPAGGIECPLCGTVHDNNIYNRASILKDKTKAEDQYNEIVRSIEKVTKSVGHEETELAKVRERIAIIESKYSSILGEDVELETVVESIAGSSISAKVLARQKDVMVDEKRFAKAIRQLNKEQKELQGKYQEDEIVSAFQRWFVQYAELVGATDINFAAVSSPLDYQKVAKEGGAAENTRAMLAYYTTVYNLIKKYGHESVAPLVVDTPNQHEQSNANYDKIIELLMGKISDSQVILCAMSHVQLEPYIAAANVITITAEKILLEDKFEEVSKHFNVFLQS